MRTAALTWILASCLLLTPAMGHAQAPQFSYPPCNRTPTEGDIAAAKGAFQAGNASFNEADYERAITYWEDAYRRDCTAHALLLNLARAYELNGQRNRAIIALETYIERNPNATDQPAIVRRIEKLQEQIQSEKKVTEPAEPAAAPSSDPVPEPLPPPDAPPPVEPDDAGPVARHRIAPLVVAGAGGVITLVGGILYFTAASDIDDLETQCPDRQCGDRTDLAEDGNAARHRQNAGVIIGVVGLGTIAGGLAWYFLSAPSEQAASRPRKASARLEPQLGARYVGVSMSGAF